MKIFDTHAHYDDTQYNEDREELYRKMYLSGVDKITLIGASLSDSISEKELAIRYNGVDGMPNFYYTVGVHPDEIIKEKPGTLDGIKNIEALENICKDENGNIKTVAIGEIGLDYYGELKNDDTYKHQIEWFIVQIELAKKLNLPIMVHSRDACKDTMEIVKEYAKGISGIIHCFSYESEIAKEYVKMGFYIGIGGVVTFKNARKLKEVVESIPIESIVTETDCPWLAPTPYRGTRNESTYIKYVIEEIARLKNMDVCKVAEIVYKNGMDVYRLS